MLSELYAVNCSNYLTTVPNICAENNDSFRDENMYNALFSILRVESCMENYNLRVIKVLYQTNFKSLAFSR